MFNVQDGLGFSDSLCKTGEKETRPKQSWWSERRVDGTAQRPFDCLIVQLGQSRLS